jgi:hypothetical protein
MDPEFEDFVAAQRGAGGVDRCVGVLNGELRSDRAVLDLLLAELSLLAARLADSVRPAPEQGLLGDRG